MTLMSLFENIRPAVAIHAPSAESLRVSKLKIQTRILLFPCDIHIFCNTFVEALTGPIVYQLRNVSFS